MPRKQKGSHAPPQHGEDAASPSDQREHDGAQTDADRSAPCSDGASSDYDDDFEIVNGEEDGLCADCTYCPDGRHRCISCPADYRLDDGSGSAGAEAGAAAAAAAAARREGQRDAESDGEAIAGWEVVYAFRGGEDERRRWRALSGPRSHTVVAWDGRESEDEGAREGGGEGAGQRGSW